MFILQFETANAAFEDAPVGETERVLRNVTERVAQGEFEGSIFDANGNRIGRFELNDQ